MLLAGRFKCPSPANPGNKTPFGASVFMHQLLCAWAFVRVLNNKLKKFQRGVVKLPKYTRETAPMQGRVGCETPQSNKPNHKHKGGCGLVRACA